MLYKVLCMRFFFLMSFSFHLTLSVIERCHRCFIYKFPIDSPSVTSSAVAKLFRLRCDSSFPQNDSNCSIMRHICVFVFRMFNGLDGTCCCQ